MMLDLSDLTDEAFGEVALAFDLGEAAVSRGSGSNSPG